MRTSVFLAAAASLSTAYAQIKGFNYGATQTDGTIKSQTDFENEFKTAQNLVGTSGFNSARLYTMIQGGTQNDPISAIQAAIDTKTTLLLGIWCSAGPDVVNNEIAALKNAINKWGSQLSGLVTGLSVGNEDLYRISPTGLAAPDAAPGADPATLVNYINQVRDAIKGTVLASMPIGHVDTWTAWVNGSNNAVTSAVDFIGMDAYPYFQSTMANGIDQNAQLFQDAYDATVAVSQGKPVWVTETGFPVSGKTSGQSTPSLQNAKQYWDQVGCDKLFGKINTYWFTLQDAYPITPNPSFGIVGATLSTTPLFDLSCPASGSVSAQSNSGSSSAAGAGASSQASSSSASINAASASALAAGATATGGLSPSQGAGNGAGAVSASMSATGNQPVASSVATISAGSGSGNGANTTVVTSVVTPKATQSSTVTGTGAATVSSAAAAAGAVVGPAVGVLGALAAMMFAL